MAQVGVRQRTEGWKKLSALENGTTELWVGGAAAVTTAQVPPPPAVALFP